MEINESLVRADLSAADVRHQAERKRLYEREHPGTRHGIVGGGHPRQSRESGASASAPPLQYTAELTKKTGTSERTVQREVARGESIPNVSLLAATSLDKPEQLGRANAAGQERRDWGRRR
jgi:hypothetical protein